LGIGIGVGVGVGAGFGVGLGVATGGVGTFTGITVPLPVCVWLALPLGDLKAIKADPTRNITSMTMPRNIFTFFMCFNISTKHGEKQNKIPN
jgi:hypothetical protein